MEEKRARGKGGQGPDLVQAFVGELAGGQWGTDQEMFERVEHGFLWLHRVDQQRVADVLTFQNAGGALRHRSPGSLSPVPRGRLPASP